MFELGKRSDVFGDQEIAKLRIFGEPSQFPRLPEGHNLICGYDQGLGERMIVCETLEDMKELYQKYA